MRKILAISILLISCSYLCSQNNSVIIGEDKSTSNITHIFKFCINDSSDQWPISSARIVFKKENDKIFEIHTNNDGIALAYFVTNNSNYNSFFGGNITIIAINYQPCYIHLDQIDYLNKGESIILYDLRKQEYLFENDLSFKQLSSFIFENNYQIYEGQGPLGSTTYYEFYEINVFLKKIPIEINVK